jgi:hypothetical protein
MRPRAPSVARQWGAVSALLSPLLFSVSGASPARSSAQRAGPVRGLLQQLLRRHRLLPRLMPIRCPSHQLRPRLLPPLMLIRRLLRQRLPRRLPRLMPILHLLRQRRSRLRHRLTERRIILPSPTQAEGRGQGEGGRRADQCRPPHPPAPRATPSPPEGRRGPLSFDPKPHMKDLSGALALPKRTNGVRGWRGLGICVIDNSCDLL